MNAIHQQTVDAITKSFADLLTANFDAILDTTDDETNKASATASVKIDFNGKMPCGVVSLSFSAKTKDEVVFRLDDPQQEKMPL